MQSSPPLRRLPTVRVSIAAAALCLGQPIAQAQERPLAFSETDVFEGLTERWQGAVRDLGVPGCSIAVVLDGEVYACSSFGVRNPDGEPVDGNTMFYIASCTKTFTAGAVAKLAGQGKIDLDAPVRNYLPRFQLDDARASHSITVRDLLCHRPGLNSRPIVFLDAYSGQISEDRFYYWLAQTQPLGHVEYSNLHFTLAGRVLEAVAGKSWKDALEEELFHPAGMLRTTAYASRMYTDPNVALPMEAGPDGGFLACSTRKSDSTMHAAGGTGTSAMDAARWLQLQLRDGELDGEQVMDAEIVREMRSQQSDVDRNTGVGHLTGFGLGWMLGEYRERAYVTHGGGYVGTAAHLSFLPDEGIGVVALANGSPGGSAFVELAATDIYDRLLAEGDVEDRLPQAIARVGRARVDEAPVDDLVGGKQLSLAPEEYLGTFTNEHWGDLVVTQADERLRAHFGALHMSLEATESDRFVGRTSGSDDFDGTFVVENGKAIRVTLAANGDTLVFERVE